MTVMPFEYDRWLGEVRDALRSINMPMDDWQTMWPFDFKGEHDRGTSPDDAAAKANRFWWQQQNKSMGRDCEKLPACWLPRGHQGECQPQFEPGDYIKVEFGGENGMPAEWMWVRVRHSDDKKKLVFGTLDNEPLHDYAGKLELGSELAVSYSQIREYRKLTEFEKQ